MVAAVHVFRPDHSNTQILLCISFFAGIMRFDFKHTESRIWFHFLVKNSIAADLGQFVETVNVISAGLLLVNHSDSTTCSQSVQPILEFCQSSAQKVTLKPKR